MNIILISRIIGFIIFGIIGAFIGTPASQLIKNIWPQFVFNETIITIISTVLLALIGFVIAPWISIKPLHSLRKLFSKASIPTLLGGLVGLIFGLVIAALLAYPLSLLPKPFNSILPFVGLLAFSYLGIALFVTRHEEFFNLFRNLSGKGNLKFSRNQGNQENRILVDTSAIIDGRIADIAETGFMSGSLIIPRFVLNELQFVSDSSDNLRRQRGRRGLEVLSQLQKNDNIPVTISDMDTEEVKEVDEKLVFLARQQNCTILTNDYNLNRVAELQGVKILNINELANAVKSILLPGETMQMKIIQEGKEPNQGVGYLEDGTMVVIEGGQKFIGQTIDITVAKVLQTAAGRMVFAKPD